MAQRFSLCGELTVLENLSFLSALYEVKGRELEQRTERLLQFPGLTDFKTCRAEHLSGGMKRNLALACRLIHEPPILLLDKPTTGVDPVSRREFWGILTELHIEGTTIVVSTPYMDEADRCSRVGLMYQGRLLMCEQPQRIRERIEGDSIELLADDWHQAQGVAAALPGVREVQTYGEALHLIVDSAPLRLPEIESRLQWADIGYRSLRRAAPRMEEAVISLIQRVERDET
jgi:ABC-2 type transport system ATP-binding protein